MREVTRMLIVEFIRQNKLTKILEMENKVNLRPFFDFLVRLHCNRSNNERNACSYHCPTEDVDGPSKEIHFSFWFL